MKLALIPHPSTDDTCLERKERERLVRQINELKKLVGLPQQTRVACSQRRLAREISYLVVEEFGDCPTIIYPWLNEENLSRLNHKHIEAICEYIKSQNTELMTLVTAQEAMPVFIRFFNDIIGLSNDPSLFVFNNGILLIDTESDKHFQKIS